MTTYHVIIEVETDEDPAEWDTRIMLDPVNHPSERGEVVRVERQD